jgi:hypothetical protein
MIVDTALYFLVGAAAVVVLLAAGWVVGIRGDTAERIVSGVFFILIVMVLVALVIDIGIVIWMALEI